jgi:hypothetical protein
MIQPYIELEKSVVGAVPGIGLGYVHISTLQPICLSAPGEMWRNYEEGPGEDSEFLGEEKNDLSCE